MQPGAAMVPHHGGPLSEQDTHRPIRGSVSAPAGRWAPRQEARTAPMTTKAAPTLMSIFHTRDDLFAAYAAIRRDIAMQKREVKEGARLGLRIWQLEKIADRMRDALEE